MDDHSAFLSITAAITILYIVGWVVIAKRKEARLSYVSLPTGADVQSLAGHASLADTQRYIEQSPEAKRRVVAM
jgi:hypothetical protein